jgi:Flp pilus assembly protein TadB
MALEPRGERGPPSRAAARLYAIGDDAVDRLERQDDLYLDRTTIRAKRQAESAEDVRDRVQKRAHREERHQADMEWHDATLERVKNNTAHHKRMQLLRFAGGCVALATSVLGLFHLHQVAHGTADLVTKLVAALG